MQPINKIYTSLPNKIKVRVNEDDMGNVSLLVLNDSIRDLIDDEVKKETADLYGYEDYCPFYQNSQDIEWFLSEVKQARYRIPKNDYCEGYKIGRYTYAVNDNNIFYMSTDQFFNLMGIC